MNTEAESAAVRSDGYDSPSPQAVAEYRARIDARRDEQQTKLDRAVLLVAAGSFTVSAAFFPRLPDPLHYPFALMIAWGSWALCIVACIAGHYVSVAAHTQVLDLLDAGTTDHDVLLGGWRIAAIPRLNLASWVLLTAGFIGFGVFTFGNLNFAAYRSDSGAAVGDVPQAAERGSRSTDGSTRDSAACHEGGNDDREAIAAETAPDTTTATGSEARSASVPITAAEEQSAGSGQRAGSDVAASSEEVDGKASGR